MSLSDKVLAIPAFRSLLASIAVDTARKELQLDETSAPGAEINWNFALSCASALTAQDDEGAQESVLRVAQGILSSTQTTETQKVAAMLMLERVGNRPAMRLAQNRNLATAISYPAITGDLAIDSLQRRNELTIVSADGETTSVNPFQRDFWQLVNEYRWISVSAPTSAGKSFIVKEWIRNLISSGGPKVVVYLAPTRALVEEVGANMRRTFPDSVGIYTLPWDGDDESVVICVYVLTQERLHALQQRIPSFVCETIFIDEAQKISEGSRGILLSQVVDESVRRQPDVKLIFASPLSENPEILISGAPGDDTAASLLGETVTVTQSLVYVRQVHRAPRDYNLTLAYRGEELYLGQISLSHNPSTPGGKVALITVALGGTRGGNVIYANGAAEAEKYARQIYEELGPDADSVNAEIQELIDFSNGVVHDKYLLSVVVTRGVAFHYGDMPLVLKARVEEAFKSGAIQYLVCTSTLLEGVNLPCRNIFMRGPRKGITKMAAGDFWNLAGRAGRWGQEFQGNIVCIDVHDSALWEQKPAKRTRSRITPSIHKALNSGIGFTDYISAQRADRQRLSDPTLEAAFSWTAGRVLDGAPLNDAYGIHLNAEDARRIESAISTAVVDLSIPLSLVRGHAGISPNSIQRLYDATIAHGDPAGLALVSPLSDDAFEEYYAALSYVALFLGGSFESESRRRSLSRLIVHWMRGVPLSVIIDNRAKWQRSRGAEVIYPKLIRSVMEQVEDIARFEAPKFLACYSDVVNLASVSLGQAEGMEPLDVQLMLELGVPRKTDMSFIAIGLSRATTRSLADVIPDESWTPAECQHWLMSVDVELLDIPTFALSEIKRNQRLGIERAD
ncbi:DEAD/DEAH box helicase [Clavibacter michiganensis]|uniref:DEAD/DEAH box helicase n=1 Tax=Clavibacter michiganensis TaxID=28447 RepID=UPI0009CD0243|nr:DEAD/DEAH box helicase [Clavibacter michiganensis]MBE3079190.1 DEAD/DEAH box helicase [Clavibacter michiganensis subsp. michiganensis]MBF4639070.1 DEAD/DEAH box helicase [Clavibacter michiganensis subsp. michiganensis]MDO4124859.1 DEAD/DEAH box helicase [Clavibacter michiganensis]MDO4139627.1 DEAD/DEAH box helicase [Clavibacter michiganensis]UDM10147.1 DEAD/DEAH box helicase [Clavibacter michiganensis subsp. michiganensis]